MATDTTQIRNVAIIAHVDHGKTTLVDGLLKQTASFRDNQAEMEQELLMDTGDQEKERGITITAKITAVTHNDSRINIVDTPGHADFGGEVERTLHMADGCLLIVDAQEGPMPQTKFVLKKALEVGLKPIVVINKIDKPGSRVSEVEDELADLFLELATDEDQLHYPVLYAIAREGKSWKTMPDDPTADADLEPVFETIMSAVPAPQLDADAPFQMLAAALDWDSYKGKYVIGRIERGRVNARQQVVIVDDEGVQGKAQIDLLFAYQGLGRSEVKSASAGDIVALTGVDTVRIGQTLADPENPEALPTIELEPPTLRMYLGPNTSPYKGLEGEFTTSRQIGDRLKKEAETNIGLKIEPDGIGYVVSGRGELHLSVLIEYMRREGYEFEVGPPQVVTRVTDGVKEEPFEEVSVEVAAEHVGTVQSEFGQRRAEMKEQTQMSDGQTRLTYEMPSRALFGLRSSLVTATKGTIIMNSIIIGYKPAGAPLQRSRNGALIAWENGNATAYSLQTAESRGTVFASPGDKVYGGQIIGINTRGDNLDLNITKEKHLNNMRSSSSDGAIQLTPAIRFSLEQCIDFLEDDELLEVTPENLRLRKRELDRNKRKKKN